MTTPTASGNVEGLLHDLAPQVLGILVRRYGDFDACEDAVQEALVAAAFQWPAEGVPGNPTGWLIRVASRRWIEQQRSETARRRREEAAGGLDEGEADPGPTRDDTLALVFLCCHPSLTPASQVALTLRAVGGLTTAEIARAFLVPEATVAQRISRAKQRIRESGAEFRMPPPEERQDRLGAVLNVLYLIFNEGYAAHSGGDLVRHDLCDEAIRLGHVLAELMPREPEILGLLALMELQASRASARTDADGNLVLLEDQDRRRWDRARIARGLACLDRAGPLTRAGAYQLQAAIAACHARAASWDATDWPRIVAHYRALVALAPSPVVDLNLAVAIGLAEGPAAGLAALDRIDEPALRDYHLLPAARAEFLRRLGRAPEAAVEYRRALRLVDNPREQAFLSARLAACETGGGSSPQR